MGKTLSILAITTQVYNINGWSIYPPHLALGDDVELPASMEHLRPYLRKRSGPIRAPPGLQHNQRYYPQSTQSRQLLMEQSPRRITDDELLESGSLNGISTVKSTFVPSRLGSLSNVENSVYPESAAELAALLDSPEDDVTKDDISKLYQQALQNPADYNNIQKLSTQYWKHLYDPSQSTKINLLSPAPDQKNGEKVKLMILALNTIDDTMNRVKSQSQYAPDQQTEFLSFGLYFFEIFKEMFVRNINMNKVLIQQIWKQIWMI